MDNFKIPLRTNSTAGFVVLQIKAGIIQERNGMKTRCMEWGGYGETGPSTHKGTNVYPA